MGAARGAERPIARDRREACPPPEAHGRTGPRPAAIRLRADEAAPEEARLWLRGLLEWADGPLEDAQLLVSELVTNSVRHAGLAPEDELEIVVYRPPPALRVMVTDPGPGFAPPAEPAPPPPSRPTGRGLYIVSRIADRWGVSCGERTCVWFEIDGPRRLEHSS